MNERDFRIQISGLPEGVKRLLWLKRLFKATVEEIPRYRPVPYDTGEGLKEGQLKIWN